MQCVWMYASIDWTLSAVRSKATVVRVTCYLCDSSSVCTGVSSAVDYRWVSSQSRSFTNWLTGEPDGGTNYNCVHMYLITGYSNDGYWADFTCTGRYSAYPYLCSYATGEKRVWKSEGTSLFHIPFHSFYTCKYRLVHVCRPTCAGAPRCARVGCLTACSLPPHHMHQVLVCNTNWYTKQRRCVVIGFLYYTLCAYRCCSRYNHHKTSMRNSYL